MTTALGLLSLYLYWMGGLLSISAALQVHPGQVKQAVIGSLFWPVIVPFVLLRR